MNEFEKLQHTWESQPNEKTAQISAQSLIKKTGDIQKGYRLTYLILIITVLVVILFYFYISGYQNTTVSIAFALMGTALFTRIGLEFWCRHKLITINPGQNVEQYKNAVIAYYKKRNYVHYLVTPLTLALYISGFTMLLPFFKVSLSYGFYMYIFISFIMLCIVGGVFFIIQIRKEQKMLTELIDFK
ncbi:MAG TPA: hypothetical protein ENH91_03190 [Leeuwenhoekiella sp.]|nr:hypothetical protein [Leeuwenhoekiella sp.]